MINWNEVQNKIEEISLNSHFEALEIGETTLKEIKKFKERGEYTTEEFFEKLGNKPEFKEVNSIFQHLKRMQENSLIWNQLFGKIEKLQTSQTEDSLFLLLYILYFVEGPLNLVINEIAYSLMVKGHHDIWSEQKQKFVSSFDELFEIRLFIKLEFLKKHGFGFLSEICSKEIRNAIAHQNFKIEPDGTVRLKNERKYTQKELREKIDDKLKFIKMVSY
jgi:hypothetical protein